MASKKNPFDSELFKKTYIKERNTQLEYDLVLAQTKLRYLMQHVDSDLVPLPPEAHFLSPKEKHDMKQQVVHMYDTYIKTSTPDELKKTPTAHPSQIRDELTNGMIYYMFYYVIQLQSEIDPSLF